MKNLLCATVCGLISFLAHAAEFDGVHSGKTSSEIESVDGLSFDEVIFDTKEGYTSCGCYLKNACEVICLTPKVAHCSEVVDISGRPACNCQCW